MQKALVWVFVLFTLLALYLTYILLFSIPIIESNISQQLPNTKVILQGEPEKVKYYDNEVRFLLNNVSVRVGGVRVLQNKTLIIEGNVQNYQDSWWVQAISVKYAD